MVTEKTADACITGYYPVNENQSKQFQNDGYILLQGVALPNEIATFRPIINAAAKRLNTEQRKLEDRDTYGKAFLQTMNLWESDERVKKFTMARKFAQVAAALLGVQNVRLYHDQALYKEPGGGPTPWHQDQFYWPVDTKSTITMWMPLIDIDEKMGMLTFAVGSHKDGLLENIPISDESEKIYDDYVKQKNYSLFRPSKMKAGDATFHYGYTLHSAPGNYSDKMREVMTIIYFADGAKITEPKSDEQRNDLKRWLGGIAPGERATSEYNPLLL